MSFVAAIAIMVGQSKPSRDPIVIWQGTYDRLIGAMKKRDAKATLAFFHKDYSEVADGVVYGLAQVEQRLPARMDVLAKYGQKPIVRAVKPNGSTSVVTVDMTFKMSRSTKEKKELIVGKSRVSDTWVRVGKEFKLYRSSVVSSSTTVNGKPFKPPTKPQ